jgi:hypothetical protein
VLRRRWGRKLDYDLFYNGAFERGSLPYSMISMPSADYVSQYVSMQQSRAVSDVKGHQGVR